METMQDLMKNQLCKMGTGLCTRPMTEEEYAIEQAERYNITDGNLNATDGFNCDICKNRGYIAKAVKNEMFGYWAETLAPCKCQKSRKAIRRLKASGLENVVNDYTFAKYEAGESWQAATKTKAIAYCNAEPVKGWFFVGGQSGSGKTHICSAIAVRFIKMGFDVKYMQWRKDVTQIKAVVNDAEQYRPLMDELEKVDVLYIDDLFKTGKGVDGKPAQPTGADINAAFEILNHRYNNKMPTIISSEKTMMELNGIDEAVAGRIAEMAKASGCCIIYKHDTAKNYRMRGITEL